MKTPTDPPGLSQFDHLAPLAAVLLAWMVPGPNPQWHARAQQEVREVMPVLARALDRAAAERRLQS